MRRHQQVGLRNATSALSALSSRKQGEYAEQIRLTLGRIREVVIGLVEVYAKTFRVNFSFANSSQRGQSLINLGSDLDGSAPARQSIKESINVYETLLVRVCSLHRMDPEWRFEDYEVTMQIYHGTRPITPGQATEFHAKTETDFYDIVKYDKWLESKAVRICNLPRESRLVFSLYGRRTVTQKETVKKELTELGWGALQLFNFEKYLAQGTFLLCLWPPEVEKQIGPAPDSGSHPSANSCPVLSVELPEIGSPVVFPDKVPNQLAPRADYNFRDLQHDDQQQLLDICGQGSVQ